jgi:phosphoglycerol transferase MdoB-like AlkP superfamily enzyme
MARVFTVAALLIGVFSVYALSQPFRYINRLLIDNVVEVNLPQGRMQAFSPAFIRAQQRVAEALPRTCSPASAPSSGSVIVVLVESLSAWHSHLLGSDKDWTPQLDTIARENHYFTHFYANGISTSMAEMSVISGHLPLTPAGKNYMEFGDYADTRGTLPDIAHRSGREAAFFTTGDVSFLDLGPWLHGLGFDRISGNDDAFYAGMPRWQFGAAEDAALYDRFLDWLDKRDNARPFVSALLTVSTHPPYVDPYTGKIDPERSFKYADAQIGRFYAELKRRGFFDHGVLMVFGDHRTMTPLHADEFAQYGDRAYARVPLIVAGAVDMPTLIEAPFQQADIPPSIAELVGLESCRTVFTGSFLRKDPQPPQYVIHARGDDRNRADVYWNADDLAGYAFDGDASRWLTPPPPDAETVAAWINTQRVATHDGAADTQISAPASTTVPASR